MKTKELRKTITALLASSVLAVSVSTNANATSGYAYSMGGLSTSVQQIINTANNWALCGYTSFYNTDITYSYLSSSSVLNSDILYFSGPGAQNSLQLENNLYIISGNSNGTSQVGLSDYTLSNTKIVVFNSSYSADGTSNICTKSRNRGADATLFFFFLTIQRPKTTLSTATGRSISHCTSMFCRMMTCRRSSQQEVTTV